MSTWQPSAKDFTAIIDNQNPWHSLLRVPETYARKTQRTLAQVLWRILLEPDIRRFHLILGPRRVGKTTVMYQTVQRLIDAGIDPRSLWWLRLDHPLLSQYSLGHLIEGICNGCTDEEPAYLFLDELTYAKDWALWLKTIYDEQWPVRIVGTSSAVSAMRRESGESGAGRWEEQYLAPYLFTEFLELVKVSVPQFKIFDSFGETIEHAVSNPQKLPNLEKHRRRFILTGGFPELLTREPSGDEASDLLRSQTILKQDAIEKAIYKDIPQTVPVQDPVKLERLLYILAGQIAGVFSPNNVAPDLEMSPRTVETYANYLERAFLIFSLSNFSPSEETVQRRGKKIYFVDGAVRNAALLRGIAPLNDPSEMGLLLENVAAGHLVTLARQTGIRTFHWRRTSCEVDLLYDHPEIPLAFEIASSTNHERKGCRLLVDKHGKYRGNCYLVSPDAVVEKPTFDSPGSLPLDLFLVLIGQQTQYIMERRGNFGKKLTNGEFKQMTIFDLLDR